MTDPVEISVADAWQALQHGAVLVDVREPFEHQTGYVPGSQLLPVGEIVGGSDPVIPDDTATVVLYCAQGQRSLLAAETLRRRGFHAVSVDGGVTAWHRAELPWEASSAPADVTRYARHLVLPEVGPSGQERLSSASVLLVGAGGLGSPVALYLAAAGVGRVVIVDDDRVELGNLQRQILHRTSRVGTPKATSAAETLSDLNPEITVEAHPVRLTSENVDKFLDGIDVVVDGTDDFETRYVVNDAAVSHGIPVVHGSVIRFEGQVSVFDPKNGPCYRCLYPAPPPPGTALSCSVAGVLGVLPGVIGTLQATEALKLILGIGQPLTGRLLTYDALEPALRIYPFSPNPTCPTCSKVSRSTSQERT